MLWLRTLLAIAFAGLALGAAPPSVPDKPIIPRSDTEAPEDWFKVCHSLGYLDADHCFLLQALGEPPAPVSHPDTTLGIRLVWSISDRGATTVVLRYELSNDADAFGTVTAYFGMHVENPWVRGTSFITKEEATEILKLERAADIWSLPAQLPRPSVQEERGGKTYVTICHSYLTLSEIRADGSKAISAHCPFADPKNAAVVNMALGLIRIARHHFPDLADDELWRNTLK